MGFGWLRDPEGYCDNLSRIPDSKDRGHGRPPTTWHKGKWGFWEFLAGSDIAPAEVYTPKPEGFKRSEKIPDHSMTLENLFVLRTALPPVILHSLSYLLFPSWKWGYVLVFLVYHIAFVYFADATIHRLHYFMKYYGTFDEENRARDIPPDRKVKRLAIGVYIYLNLRVIMAIGLAYDEDVFPLSSFSIYSPLKLAAWMLALDYYFYAYHRSCHDVNWLWFIHRGHHATRHPTPLFSILADDIQEFLEIFFIPWIAALTVPRMTFSEQWVGTCYMLYVEAMGHSGIRAYWTHPIFGKFLRIFGMDLSIEDHDLHHRHGRDGLNFGKASLVYDTIFNTAGRRVEVQEPRSFKLEVKLAGFWNKLYGENKRLE